MMKRFIKLSLLVGCLFMAFACNKNQDNPQPPQDDLIVIKGNAPSYKTVLSMDDTTCYWSSYDKLGLFLLEENTEQLSDRADISFSSVSLRSASFYPESLSKLSDWKTYSEGGMYAFAPLLYELPTLNDGCIELNVPEEQTEEWGRSQILVAGPAAVSRVVNFQFKPATSMLCLRLNLSSGSNVPTLKVAKIEIAFEGAHVVGDCRLNLLTGKLEASESAKSELKVVFEKSLMVIRSETDGKPNEFNSFTYFSLIPSLPSGKILFKITDVSGNVYTTDAKAVPEAGFVAGGRYLLDRFFTAIVNSEDDADGTAGSYTEEGNMWDNGVVNNDGAYDDAGEMW